MGKSLKEKIFLLLVLFVCSFFSVLAQTDTATKNIVYAEAGNRKLLVDIYMPPGKINPYLIVWIHGGAWRSGSKENPPLGLLSAGYAIASVDFRLSTEATFPAPVCSYCLPDK